MIAQSAYRNQYPAASFLNNEKGILALRQLVRGGSSALQKAGYVVGTPPDTANDLVSFLPQDLARIFSEQTRGDRQIVLTKRIPTLQANSTRFYMAVQQSDGDTPYIPNFQSETGLSAQRVATTEQPYVDLKQHGDRRIISATAMQVGLIGGLTPMGVPQVSRDGLGKALRDSVRAKRKAFERDLFWASSTVNTLEFDSIPKQIDDNGIVDLNVFDLRDQYLTWETVFSAVALNADSKYGTMTEEIMLSAAQMSSLTAQASDSGRWDRSYNGKTGAKPSGNGWTYNPDRMGLTGPMDQFIPLVVAPFLNMGSSYEYTLASVGTPASTVTIANQTSATAGGAGSDFTSADAGDYIYGVVASFAQGTSAGYVTATIPVTAGQEVTIVMNDAAIGSATNPLYSYTLFRSDKGGSAATLKPLKRYPAQNVSGHTEMVDDNSTIAGTDLVMGLQYGASNPGDGGAINMPTLLDPVRFPLPVTDYVGVQHVVLSIQAPKIWHPYRQILFKNCKRAAVPTTA
jgi:hypothetical protein